MAGYEYAAFISYRHRPPDEAVAKKLHSLIENYGIPKDVKASSGRKKMGRVFRDQEELPLSSDLGSDIKAALERSEWLIAICSEDYLQSKWCMLELDYFISLGRRDRILAVLVRGEPEDAFPRQLRFMETEGGTVELEPLAADVRAESVPDALKKLRREVLRVLAPMLGVSYDQLRQRARRRRLRIAAASSAAAFALLGGFLAYALVKNARISEQNRQISAQNEQISRQNVEIAEQRDLAVDNQMQVLIGQASVYVGSGNKLPAKKLLAAAAQLRATVGEDNDEALYSALEAALYAGSFETVQTVDVDNRRFTSVVFSHDDRYLLGITNLNSAALLDAGDGKLLFTVSRSDVGELDSVGFTPDDKYFYTVDSWYGYVSLYRTDTGELYREFSAYNGTAWNIGPRVFALEDHRILIPMEDCCFLWDYEADDGEAILPTEGGLDSYIRASSADLAPDGSAIVVSSPGYGIGLTIKTLDGKSTLELEKDPQRGYDPVVFSPDGRYVAGASVNRYYVWSAETGRLLCSGTADVRGYGTSAVLLNREGSLLVFTSAGYLCAVEVPEGRLLWELRGDEGTVTEARISPNGKYVSASGGVSGVFDALSGERLAEQGCSAFSNDGRKLLVDTGSNAALLASPEAATARITEGYEGALFTTPRYTSPDTFFGVTLKHNCAEIYSTFPGNAGRKTAMYISPDKKYAAGTHYDGFIEVFDISDPENVRDAYCIAEHCYFSVEDVVFNGSLMASCGGYDPRCAVFDLEKGTMKHVLRGEGYAHLCEFSPDGSKLMLLCGRGRDLVMVYSVQTGNLLYRISAPGDLSFTEIGFSEDGSRAVAKLSDGRAAVGELYGTLEEMIGMAGQP